MHYLIKLIHTCMYIMKWYHKPTCCHRLACCVFVDHHSTDLRNTSDGYTQVPTTIGLPQAPSERDRTHFQDPPSDEEECGDVDLGTLGQKLDDSEDEDDSYPLALPLCNHGNSSTHSSTTNGTVQELEVDADIVDLRPNMDPRQRLSMDTQMLSMDSQMFSMDPFRTNTDPLRTRVEDSYMPSTDWLSLASSTGRHVNTSSNLHVVATNSGIGLPDWSPDHSQQSLSKRSCKCACSPERCGHPLHRIKGWVRDFVTLIRLVGWGLGTCELHVSVLHGGGGGGGETRHDLQAYCVCVGI